MIEFRNASKTYRSLLGREVHAVEDFSLQVADGEVLGIAGPNGAGKSTLISLLLGFLNPTSGSVTIYGQAPRAYIEQNGVGYLSELVKITPRWRTEDALTRFAVLGGIPAADVQRRVNEVIDLLGLAEHRDKKFKALSKGNAQRVGLAQALLRQDRVIVLDEPTHGLDPLWTQRFRDIVNEIKHPSRIILIASHNLDELQRLCDRVAIVDRGRLQRLVSTGFEQASASGSGSSIAYRIRVVSGEQHVLDIFPDAITVSRGEYDVLVADLATLNRNVVDLIGRGALVAGVAPTRSALEEQFRAAVGVEA